MEGRKFERKQGHLKTGPGLSCSKLTTPLVNVLLKFQMLIPEKCQNVLLKKCEKLLVSTTNISVFGYEKVGRKMKL